MKCRHKDESILLIYPRVLPENKGEILFPPYSVLIIGSALTFAGYTVTLIDEQLLPKKKSLLETVKKIIYDTDILFCGVSCTMVTQLERIGNVLTFLKQKKIPSVIGGAFVSLFPQVIMEKTGTDFVIVEDGLHPICVLSAHLENQTLAQGIPGIICRGQSHHICGSCTPPEQLPRYDLSLIEIEKYIHQEDGMRTFLLLSSIGCKNGCKFCINTRYSKWIPLSVSDLFYFIERLWNEFNIQYVKFIDDNPLQDIKRIIKLFSKCEQHKIGLKFYIDCTVRDINSHYFSVLAPKLYKVYVGIETPSKRLQSIIGKKLSKKEIKKAVCRLADYGIRAKYSLIHSLPGETAQDQEEQNAMINWIKQIQPKSEISIKEYTPLPDTPLWNEYPEFKTSIDKIGRLANST